MMITMHSMLRDSYRRRAIFLDLVILTTSLIIAALAFGDSELFDWLPIGDNSSRLAIGLVSIITFSASFFAWMVDWKSKANAHERAASAYSAAKFLLGSVDSTTRTQEIEQILMKSEEAARSSIAIPEAAFLRLKSEHLLKIRISRILDRSPSACLLLVKLRLRLRHTKTALKQVQSETETSFEHQKGL